MKVVSFFMEVKTKKGNYLWVYVVIDFVVCEYMRVEMI